MKIPFKFGFIPVASNITPVPPEEIASHIQNRLLKEGAVKLSGGEISVNMPVVFLVLTGGTEKKIIDLFSERKNHFGGEPLLLIAHTSNNSLPASLETLAKLKQEGNRGKIIYMDEFRADELNRYLKFLDVYHKLFKTKIGMIGNPSDWLIASSPDAETIGKLWGAEICKIDIKELTGSIDKADEIEALEKTGKLLLNASSVSEPSEIEIIETAKVYGSLKEIAVRYKLNAVTVRCFDLVTGKNTTGCFALAGLNDEGIIAGCEGDIVSTLGMVWLNYFTGKQAWMANPSRLNEKNNSLWLAHCTAPLNMISEYNLRSHFESGLGVGIQGQFEKGDVTLLRLGGRDLDKIWIAEGELTECGSDENLCRTQAHIKLKEPAKVSDLLNNPLGNHLLMVYGNYAGELKEWWELFIK